MPARQLISQTTENQKDSISAAVSARAYGQKKEEVTKSNCASSANSKDMQIPTNVQDSPSEADVKNKSSAPESLPIIKAEDKLRASG